jgi:signal transduction histidine kinase
MPRGGDLLIQTARLELNGNDLEIRLGIPAGRYTTLAVVDTGQGMDPETKSHIFEPFFTTKEDGKGTGLGLATVSGILKQAGGYASVESTLGRGTTFKMYFPAAGEVIHRNLPEA